MKSIIFLLIIFVIFPLWSQQQIDDSTPKLQELTIKHGLTNLNVSSIVQDDLGYIWISTARGLNKYDGTSIQAFLQSDIENSINSNMVIGLHKNSSGLIFCSTSNGVNIINTNEDKIYSIESKLGCFTNFVEHDNKTYAVSGLSGLCVFNYNLRNFERIPHVHNNLNILNILADSSTGIWGISHDNLFLINYNPTTNNFTKFPIPEGTSMANAVITLIDSTIIIIGSTCKAFSIPQSHFIDLPYRFNTIKKLSSLKLNFTKRINKNLLWIGTQNNGLYIYNIEDDLLKNINKANSNINSNFIVCGILDNDSNMWLGTFDHGVNIAFRDRRNVNFDNTLNNITNGKFINSITSDNQSNLYIGTRYDGVYIYNQNTKQVKQLDANNGDILKSNHIRTIFIDSKEQIWISTSKALTILSSDLRIINQHINESNHLGFVSFSEYNGDVFACSGQLGFIIFDLNGHKKKQVTKLDHRITQIIPLKLNEILVETYTRGIFLYNTKTNYHRLIYNPSQNSPSNIPLSITMHLDKDSVLWVGNYTYGLHMFDLKSDSVKQFTKDDGLPNNDVIGIIETSPEALWLSTSYGVSLFNKTDQFINFYYNEGLENLQYHANSAHLGKNGIVYFGGNEGLSYFDPNRMLKSVRRKKPKMIIESITINNQTIKVGDETGILKQIINNTSQIKLNHKQNSITIKYHAFDYAAAQEVKYYYILEGLEKKWNNVGKRKFANYSNLKPGFYTFKVKAQNNKGDWSNEATIKTKIKHSPFLTIWAYLIYIITIGLGIFFILNLIFKTKLYKRKVELEQKERQREHEISQMKMRFFTNISHEIRTPLTLIKGNVDLLSKSINNKNAGYKAFNGIRFSTERLLALVNQLLSLRKLENDALDLMLSDSDIIKLTHLLIQPYLSIAEDRNISIKVESEFDHLIIPFDEDKYEKIINNLLSNSLKHITKNGEIKIKIDTPDEKELIPYHKELATLTPNDFIKISIIDNGAGISQKDLPSIFNRFNLSESDKRRIDYSGTGIGLHFTKRLVDLHKGLIIAKSIENVETKFSLILSKSSSIYTDYHIYKQPASQVNSSTPDDHKNTITTSNKSHILIVEDDTELNQFINSSLQQHFKTSSCFNGKEGIELAKEKLPDVIISDIMMPVMNGYELCKAIREDDLISHIPIILLTAKTDSQTEIIGYNYGIDHYVSKPFALDVLIAKIYNLIENRKQLQKIYRQGTIYEQSNSTINQYELNFVKHVDNIIQENYRDTTFNVKVLADKMNMSRANFYRKFVNIISIPPKEFITKYRINKSIEFFNSKNKSIGEISELCGFSTQSNFSLIFKKEKGVSPTKYLTSQKLNNHKV